MLQIIDNLFLGRELSEASQLHRQVKNAIAQGQAQINRQNQEAVRLDNLAESLRAQICGLREEINSLERQRTEAANQLSVLQRQLKCEREQTAAKIAELHAEVNRERAGQLSQLSREIDSIKADKLVRVKAEVNASRGALEADLQAVANRLQEEHQQLKQSLETASDDLKASHRQQQEELAANHAAELERLTQSHIEAVAGLEADLQKRENQLSQVDAKLAHKWGEAEAELQRRATVLQEHLQAQIDIKKAELAGLEGQIKERLRLAELEEEERIRVARKAFQVEMEAATVQLRSEQLEANEALKSSKAQIIEEYRGAIEQPLLDEIAALTIELGRVKKKISKDNMNWQPNQIREFFVKEREGKAEPTHVRIGGASESGKSYMINQLVSGGLASMGVEAVDFFLLDPYGSDTKWDVEPAVYDDAERAAEVVRNWGKNAKGDKLPRPTILMIDEFDTLVAEFDLAQAVKDVVKLGRHRNRFLWMIGQSGNCPKGFTWTDVKNLNQIYLGSVAEDYVNNGLKGRGKNKWLGEIEALREKSKFHAIVTPKDCNPYTVLIPAVLFPSASPAHPDTGNSAQVGTGLRCPKCGSENVRKDGTYDYRGTRKQRLKCGACGKGSSVPIE